MGAGPTGRPDNGGVHLHVAVALNVHDDDEVNVNLDVNGSGAGAGIADRTVQLISTGWASDRPATVARSTVRLKEATHGDAATATQSAGRAVRPLDPAGDRARRESPPRPDDARARLDGAHRASPGDSSEQAQERGRSAAASAYPEM